jgi:hypothetical protein
MKIKYVFPKVLLAMFVLLILPLSIHAANDQSSDETLLKNQTQQVLQEIDSTTFANDVSNDEFIVRAYQLVDNRKPDAFEFYYCKLLFTKNNLTRSNLLALLMAGDANDISWDKCRTFIKAGPASFLKNTADIQQDVQKLQNAPTDTIIREYKEKLEHQQNQTSSSDSSKLLSTSVTSSSTSLTSNTATTSNVPYDSYNTYFGYLHAHTSYSDGAGSPSEAYQYARDSGKLDFFAVTDHGELIIFWPWQKKWKKIKSAADAYYAPGSFVTLWGFEWSNPIMGHVNILNTSDYTNCLAKISIDGLYNWLEDRSDGFGTFNHPGDYDSLGTEFWHFDLTEPEVIPQMVGIETWNGSNGFKQYFYKNNWASCEYSYLDAGNKKGWLLGALGGQDNHDKSWGAKNQFRTAVLAKELTRESIIEAYRARRFYATEDKDLYLDFRCSGYPMGSQVSGVSRYFTVSASDKSGDTFAEVCLYRNGDLIGTQSVSGDFVSVVFTDYTTTSNAYYYVVVKENDDNDGDGMNDEAISSPIWIQ